MREDSVAMELHMFDLKGYEASLLEGAWVTLEVALASLLESSGTQS